LARPQLWPDAERRLAEDPRLVFLAQGGESLLRFLHARLDAAVLGMRGIVRAPHDALRAEYLHELLVELLGRAARVARGGDVVDRRLDIHIGIVGKREER